jgi:hypothetical protein
MADKPRTVYSVKQKALSINLDPTIYGTFAEIGAGQEVARNFFRVGGSSGTIAKSMSAYDMAFSDSIYGPEPDGRYVSESRLVKMLEREYKLMETRLTGEKYENCRFFAFANTLTTLNFSRTNEPHGWIGLRFQLHKNSEPNDIILHVRPYDNNTMLQQNVIGELGVNLIYGSYNYSDDPETIVKSLLDNLSTNQIEIDMVRITGPDYKNVDNRLLSLILVRKGFTNATIFGPNKEMLQPKDFLYKKDILILRGRFRPVTLVNEDMLVNGLKEFKKEFDCCDDKLIVLSEMTLSNLDSGEEDQSRKDFVDRAEILCSLGHHVMVSNYQEHYKLANYLTSCRAKNIGIVIGVLNLLKIYGLIKGTDNSKEVLNSFGQLFANNVKMYAYPYQHKENGEIITAKNLKTSPQMENLHRHFLVNGLIKDIEEFNETNLQIFSDDIIDQIKAGENGWESKVPANVAELVKRNCLFNYPCEYIPEKKDFSVKK